MPDRRRQIAQLIGSRFDLLWFPAGALRTSGGLAPSKRVPCPACAHLDRPGFVAVKRGGVVKRWDPCTACGGVTGDKPKAGRGVVAVDPMDATRSVVGSTDTHATARPRKRVKCDGCQDHDGNPTGVTRGERCRYCDGTGFRDLHAFDLQLDTRDADGQADPIDNAIDRRDNAGSYHQLDVALAAISRHVNKPLRYVALTLNADQARKLLDELYLHRTRELDRMTLFEQALVELAMAYLDERMPDPIVVPADVRANERQVRDHRTRARGRSGPLKVRNAEIRKLARQGKPAQWIAAEYGLHVSSVYEIVNGKEQVA